MVRIATWNINSVNRRLEQLSAWLARNQPDIVCLQETKCRADDFPSLMFEGLGYSSAACGDGAWNGVAILSRVGLEQVRESLDSPPRWEGKVEPRALAAVCGGIRVWSLYIPNGRTPQHEHYQYKLQWLDELGRTAAAEAAEYRDLALLGDFNIAPTDADVWDLDHYADSTHITAAERARLEAIEGTGLHEIVPRPLKYDVAFTFWDYRQLAFPKNRGMRIDLVYGSDSVAGRVRDAFVDREARKGKGASDHAPIVVDVADDA